MRYGQLSSAVWCRKSQIRGFSIFVTLQIILLVTVITGRNQKRKDIYKVKKYTSQQRCRTNHFDIANWWQTVSFIKKPLCQTGGGTHTLPQRSLGRLCSLPGLSAAAAWSVLQSTALHNKSRRGGHRWRLLHTQWLIAAAAAAAAPASDRREGEQSGTEKGKPSTCFNPSSYYSIAYENRISWEEMKRVFLQCIINIHLHLMLMVICSYTII